MKKRLQKLTAVLMSALMLSAAFMTAPLTASAAEAQAETVGASSGVTGDCTWTLDDDGVLTISGQGAMGDYSSTGPWGTKITSVVIENGVTNIGGHVFEDCSDLASAEIPDTVTNIGYAAFKGCSGINFIEIPDSVTSIGELAFSDCTNLKSIIVPDSVTYIGVYEIEYSDDFVVYKDAFVGDRELIIYGHSGTYIEEYARKNGRTFQSVNRSNATRGFTGNCTWTLDDEGVLTISGQGEMGWYRDSFFNDSSYPLAPWGLDVKKVVIGDGVTNIGHGAFVQCPKLTSIVIGDSVSSIDWHAFENGNFLTSITVSPNNPNYDSRDNCNAVIETATNRLSMGCANTVIPNSVTSIGTKAFANCIYLKSMVIPDSVTSIESGAFYRCYDLTSMVIPDSVTNIGSSVFYQCYDLASIVIPNSVTKISYEMFYECYDLTNIVIPNSVTKIDNDAFNDCYHLREITIPGSVKSIGKIYVPVWECDPEYVGIGKPDWYYETYGLYVGNRNLTVYGYSGTFIEEYCKRYCVSFSSLGAIGGVTSDNDVNIKDVTAIQRYLGELEAFNDDQLFFADTNGDGVVNISDATHLQRYLAEYDVVLG